MPAYIHTTATAVPEHSYEQAFLRERMKEYVTDNEVKQRIIHQIYSRSGIRKRHSIINDFNANGSPRFYFQKDGSMSAPSTGIRNELYTRHAKKLFVKVAQKLIDGHPGISAGDITHVITVSCTGFFAPGPAFEIVKRLSLRPSTERYHLGFMGCFGAFPALKMAKSFCESDPDSVVLVVCLELCSLHFQDSDRTDNLISASVFADGAGGVIVAGSRPALEQPYLELNDFATSIADQSEKDMAWTIGDQGFDMILSSYVPEIIEGNLPEAVNPLLNEYGIDTSQIDRWALHPGGRAILDKAEKSLKLEPRQLESSRTTLEEYGNMSSATIIFVLDHLLRLPMENTSEQVLAMAFGPGLTIESGLLTKKDD